MESSLTVTELLAVFDKLQEDELAMFGAGNKEYAHSDENALANFDRVASHLGISRERVLMVYLLKHIDGISSWIKGHRSQREDVRGRIIDARVYLGILDGMISTRED